MNHMLTDDYGSYKTPKHWRDKEDLPPNSGRYKSKNEIKTPLFIFIKQAIDAMTTESASRVERYVENYCKLENATELDKSDMRLKFQLKLRAI